MASGRKDALCSIGTVDDRFENELIALEAGCRSDRGVAAGTQLRQERPLGGDAAARRRVIDVCQERVQFNIVRAALDPKCSLADGRVHCWWREDLRNAVRKSQALETGDRQDDSVELACVELADARLDVAARF